MTDKTEMTQAQVKSAGKIAMKLIDRATDLCDEELFLREGISSTFVNYEKDWVFQFKRGDIVYEMCISARREAA